PPLQDTQTRSRLIIGQNGPSDFALAASSGWRLRAAQPLTGTRRAALLGTCARAAPLGAIRPRLGRVLTDPKIHVASHTPTSKLTIFSPPLLLPLPLRYRGARAGHANWPLFRQLARKYHLPPVRKLGERLRSA